MLPEPSNFIEEFIVEDLEKGRYTSVHTRLPPEPNGCFHIGHAKNIFVNCAPAGKFGGLVNLRFDDTNPAKEGQEFVDAIMNDIKWLGYDWTGGLFFGSDYFDQCYDLAEKLIRSGDAYVCDLSKEDMRAYRGTLTQPGKNSPFRDRGVEENLDLFRRMRQGEFPDGARTLRAKIDMASPNINMRDPAMYRIMHRHHYRTGDKWCIYPMYDYAHPIQDAIEGITHSLCSFEYEAHRPLYEWVLEKCGFEHKPRQIEYARLNITRTVLSKRYLRALVESGLVSGWDDPRMPTLMGMRRRGYRPAAILDFIGRAGVAKANSVVDATLLEHCVREEHNLSAPRAMAVLRPLKITLTNWPEDSVDTITLENHPDKPEMGTREIPFGRTLWIEQEDFMLEPTKKFFRLKPGGEVRLKSAYIIRCDEVLKDERGEVSELLCTVDLDSRSGTPGAERKVKGTLHWLPAKGSLPAEFRLYDYMLKDDSADIEEEDSVGDEGEGAPEKHDYIAAFNHASIQVLRGYIEPSLGRAEEGQVYQFMRQGYYCVDQDSTAQLAVFNRTVSLKDSYAKAAKP